MAWGWHGTAFVHLICLRLVKCGESFFAKMRFHIENDALGCQTLRQVAFPKTLQELASLFATDEDMAATFGSTGQ